MEGIEMETKVGEDGCVVVTKGCEVSTGGMAVVIVSACAIGLVCGILVTNAYRALQFKFDVYSNERRVVQVNGMRHDGHEYLYLTEAGKEDVFGFCHSPRCSCVEEDRSWMKRSLEAVKYGVSMMGQYLQSATEQTVNEARKAAAEAVGVDGAKGNGEGVGEGGVKEKAKDEGEGEEQGKGEAKGKGNGVVSVVPKFDVGRFVEQKREWEDVGRCDKDGTPNMKGRYVRRTLSTRKVVDTGAIGTLESGASAPLVSAEIRGKGEADVEGEVGVETLRVRLQGE